MPTPAIATATLLTAIAAAGSVGAQPVPAGSPSDAEPTQAKIHVEHNPETFITRISIRAHGGRVAWADVLRALARARGHDDAALQGVLPKGRFDITSTRWRVMRTGLNVALRPKIRFDVKRAEDRHDEPRLVITLDRAALLASRRRFKAWLRNAFLKKLPLGRQQYGLTPDDAWEKAPADRNLVVLVHGLNSSPEQLDDLLTEIRKQRFPCAMFRYPNDQPIADSAKLLARELKRLAEDHPQRGVSLVAHSMGGLVARAVIEAPESDPGNVRQLIMIAPPNHGSALARFAFGLELKELIKNETRRTKTERFYALIEDGLSEAAVDLRPGSPLLRTLNARDRNPKVRYTIFLGSDGPLNEAELSLLRRRVAGAGRRSRWVRFFGPRVHKWLEDLDEVVEGKGDGVVAIERGRLEGVKDTLVLCFRHARVLRTSANGDVKKVHREILKRLKETPGAVF